LLLPCVFKLFRLFRSFLSLSLLFSTEVALTLLKGSLGTEGVDLGLAIGRLLLHLSKSLDLVFFLLTDAALLFETRLLLGVLLAVVTDNLHFLVFFLLDASLLSVLSKLVADFDLGHHLLVFLLLKLGIAEILLFQLLDCSNHLRLLLFQLLTLLLPLKLSVLYLVNDNCGSLALGLDTLGFALLENLEFLETLNFHHEVKAFLFIEPLLFKDFILLELLVADSDHLGVEDHLIHVFDVVNFFIHLLLRL